MCSSRPSVSASVRSAYFTWWPQYHSLYLMEWFQWKLPPIFTVWVRIAEDFKVMRSEFKVTRRQPWKCCELNRLWTADGTWTKFYTNSYYTYGTIWLWFQGHGIKVQGHMYSVRMLQPNGGGIHVDVASTLTSGVVVSAWLRSTKLIYVGLG